MRETRSPEEEGRHLSVKSNRLEGNRIGGGREKERGERRDNRNPKYNGIAKKKIEEI